MPARGPEIDGLLFLDSLGTGGYSDVFLYERASPRMRVAVKVLRAGKLGPAERAQFAAEAETMAELADHPYIVQVFSTGELSDGRPYLVMKYFPPPNLGERAKRERFSVPEVLRTGVKIASAVEAAHRVGILHRDIKPANILISQYGEPGLSDFGIAGRPADGVDGVDGAGSDEIGVSIPWAPPEVLTGVSNGSPQSDVYSLAATVWHLLAGRSPFEVPSGDNLPAALVVRILRTPPPPTGRADVPPSLERLLAQAMAKNPAVRPRTALEFARGLQAVEQEQRFGRTDIVVPGLGGSTGTNWQLPAPDTADQHTRTRATGQPSADQTAPPTTVRPQRPTSLSQPVPHLGAAQPPTTAEPPTTAAPPTAAAPPTTMRPVRASTAASHTGDVSLQPGQHAERPERGSLGKGWAVLAAAVVVVAALVIGIALSRGGSGGATKSSEPTAKPIQQLTVPPGQPVVSATYDRARKAVVFTWTYTDHAPGDYFEVAPSLAAPKKSIDVARYVVASTSPKTTCLVVAAYRATTQIGSEYSKRICG